MEKNQAVQQNPFSTEPIGKLLTKFAVPCIISMLVNALYNIVDQIFIGRGVGYLGNGATNVVFPITIIALAFALLLGDGGAAFLSLKLGEDRVDEAKKGVGSAITMVTLLSLVLLALVLIFLEPIVNLFGATDKLRPYALEYGSIIALGLPLTMISTALNSIIRADGSPRFAMISMLTGAILNTILDPIFIFVFNMGVQGAAIATVIGQIFSFAVSVLYLPRFKTFKLEKSIFKLNSRITRQVMSLGVSSFITQISITVVMAVTNNLLTLHGASSIYGAEIPLTAMGIVMKVNQIMNSILVGIAVGAQPIIGFNYGSRNFHRVKQTYRLAVIVAEVVAILGWLLFQFGTDGVIALFGAEEELYNEFARLCFRIFLLLCPLTGFQTISSIFMQAIGKPGQAAVMSLSRQILFLVPASILLPLAMGVVGILWAGPVADGLAFVLALVLIIREMKGMHVDKALA